MDFTEAYDSTCSSVGLCCREGNAVTLQKLLESGKSVDVMDNRGWRPVHEAAKTNNVPCLRILLKHESNNVDWQTFEGETPLLLAAGEGHEEAVHSLIRGGATVNLANNEGTTPLIAAAAFGSLSCVTRLTKSEARITDTDVSGQTALHAASNTVKGTEVIRHLLMRKANPKERDCDHGMTPIFMAAYGGFTENLNVLLEHCAEHGFKAVDITASDGTTPLMIACQHGHSECVQLLLKHEADVNFQSPDNVMPLHLAIAKGNIELVKCLLPKTKRQNLLWCSLEPLRPNYDENGPSVSHLHLAVDKKWYDILQYLLEQEPFPDDFLQNLSKMDLPRLSPLWHSFPDREFKRPWPNAVTALGYAVMKNDVLAATLLLTGGCRLNPGPYNIWDPLTLAATNGCHAMLQLLLLAGADPNHRAPKLNSMSWKRIFPLLAAKLRLWVKGTRTLLVAGADLRRILLPYNYIIFQWRIRPSIPDRFLVMLMRIFANFAADERHAMQLLCCGCKLTTPKALLYQYIPVVSSLAHLCRITIRESILDASSGIHYKTKIAKLEVPQTLLKFLNFDEQLARS